MHTATLDSDGKRNRSRTAGIIAGTQDDLLLY